MSKLYWYVGAILATLGVYLLTRKSSPNAVALAMPDAVDTAGAVAENAPVTGILPSSIRGIRNNNPGNIKYNPNTQWVGQTGSDGVFCTFDSMEHGIRAMARILKNYQRLYGCQTVPDFITRWSSTDQAAYIAQVESSMGVGDMDTLNMDDPNTLTDLVRAIITQEDTRAESYILFAAGQIQAGVALA